MIQLVEMVFDYLVEATCFLVACMHDLNASMQSRTRTSPGTSPLKGSLTALDLVNVKPAADYIYTCPLIYLSLLLFHTLTRPLKFKWKILNYMYLYSSVRKLDNIHNTYYTFKNLY